MSKESDQKFRQIVQQVVDKRLQEKSRSDDLLQVILDLREKHGKEEYSDTVVCGHSMTFLVRIWIILNFINFINLSYRPKGTRPAAQQCPWPSMN